MQISKDASQHTPDRQPTHAPNLPDEKRTLAHEPSEAAPSRWDGVEALQRRIAHEKRNLSCGTLFALLLLIVPLFVMPGCTAALERAQADANASYRESALANVNTNRVMGKAYRQLADDKHDIQAKFDERLETDFLDSHTDENGSLVSRDPDGNIVPMRAADILQFIRDRDERRALLTESKHSHATAVERYEAALTQFEVATKLMDDKNADYEKAKAEAREAHNVAIQALLGIAAAGAAAAGL